MSTTEAQRVAAPLGVCLGGPTGAGKTALALAFARALAHEGGTGIEIKIGRAHV